MAVIASAAEKSKMLNNDVCSCLKIILIAKITTRLIRTSMIIMRPNWLVPCNKMLLRTGWMFLLFMILQQ